MPKDLNSPPPLWWTLFEPRVGLDIAAFLRQRRKLKNLPKGDGHPVLVIPGFLSDDRTTAAIRSTLKNLDYRVYGWAQGQNKSFHPGVLDALSRRLTYISKRNQGRTVSLIGWSLGGVIARELAKLHPELVRQVITLGSPISGNFTHTPAYILYKRLNGAPTDADLAFYKTLSTPPPMPTTSIYSKSDGVVAWRNSIQEEGPLTENIRVGAGHFGMGFSPAVMAILADRLSQPEGQWEKFGAEPAHITEVNAA